MNDQMTIAYSFRVCTKIFIAITIYLSFNDTNNYVQLTIMFYLNNLT